MTTHTIPQTVLFPDLFDKPLVATFNRQHASSDGGAVLLKAAERVYGLVAGFARCLVDRRELGKIRHTLTALLGQRIFGIACGHPDGNDAEHLADDPIHKLLLGRDPVAGEALASQPTISRFENGVGPSALYVLARELAMRVIERHRRRLEGRARRITIDLDPTDDATHGAQQLTFFNGHYDSWCYLPLLAFLTFDKEREQYLCAAVLRPGNVPATRGTVGVLCRLLPLLRQAFPQARFLVRLDGGFATPEVFDFLDAEPRLDYVVAMAKNAVLQRHAEPALLVARAQSAATGETAHRNELVADVDAIPAAVGAADRVLADSGYATGSEVSQLERRGMEVLVATGAEGQRRRHDFRPEPPERVPKAPQADWIKSMQEKMARPEHRARYRLRKQTVEPVFGIVKQAMGFRQFLLRGLEKVEGEWTLVTLAYNCRRVHSLRLA